LTEYILLLLYSLTGFVLTVAQRNVATKSSDDPDLEQRKQTGDDVSQERYRIPPRSQHPNRQSLEAWIVHPYPKLTYILDSFPSSAGFDILASALSDDAERKDAIKKGGAIFAFTLKNPDGETADWHIDLKESGKVGKGTAPEGKKANGKTCEHPSALFKLPRV
jgi:hypothetical protein